MVTPAPPHLSSPNWANDSEKLPLPHSDGDVLQRWSIHALTWNKKILQKTLTDITENFLRLSDILFSE